VTDDPWRKPDPNAPVPPPAYGPPGGYYVAPAQAPAPSYPPQYAPGPPAYNPYNAYNPYQAPLPKRGGYKRLLWILGTVGVLVLGGCGVGIWFVANSVTKNIAAANTFLGDVRDQNFTAAYQRLCPEARNGVSDTRFTGALQSAASRGHQVISFDITASNSSENFGSNSGTVRTASGNVTFSGGQSELLTFELGSSEGQVCVLSGYAALF
jgi:hypothetical protein